MSASAETDKSGRIKVEPGLALPRFRNIFVIGDLALSLDRSGKPLPGLAQVAMQGGIYAASSILKRIKAEQELPPFEYLDKGNPTVVGRAAAVANAFGFKVSGLPAWLVWAFIHLMYIVQFQSRVLGVYSVGTPRPHLQPWCANDHRYDNNRFQLQQGDCGSTVSTDWRDNTTRRNYA